MKVKWTKADEKRAKQMGWMLVHVSEGFGCRFIAKHGDRFKSDDDAIEWVIDTLASWYVPGVCKPDYSKVRTCRKALMLCAKG